MTSQDEPGDVARAKAAPSQEPIGTERRGICTVKWWQDAKGYGSSPALRQLPRAWRPLGSGRFRSVFDHRMALVQGVDDGARREEVFCVPR
jgi:hypothetical protein